MKRPLLGDDTATLHLNTKEETEAMFVRHLRPIEDLGHSTVSFFPSHMRLDDASSSVDVGVVGESFVGGHQVLLRQSSTTAGGHGSGDGRAERVGSVSGLLHDQREGVRSLFLVVTGSVPG